MFKSYLTKDWAKQRKAIEKIRSEKKLIQILLSDMSRSGLPAGDQNNIRRLCIENISNQTFIAQFYMALAGKMPLETLGRPALERISDQSLLYALVRQHSDDLGKRLAAAHISDKQRLKSVVADNAMSSDVRCAAMKRLQELQKTRWSQDDELLFSQIALNSFEDSKLRNFCGDQLSDEYTLCRLILEYIDDESMRLLCDRIMKDERVSNRALLMKIALADNRLSAAAAKRIDSGDARIIFLQTTLPDVEKEAMGKMAAGELLALFDELPRDSIKREHIATCMPEKFASASWWRQRAAEYPQHSSIFLRRLAWCGDEDDVIRYVQHLLKSSKNSWEEHQLCEKFCSFALIESLEKMVSEGDRGAAVLLRWLYSEAQLPEGFAQHASRQQKRFRDVHEDGYFGNCAGSEGHSDYVKERLIEPI